MSQRGAYCSLSMSLDSRLGRLGQADEVAAMVTFLASDAAGFCTGNYYAVEGGLLVR
jgi:NAD(P)-dependent dehydrogenase (short-subunit alcohol dehydrogenase family)